MAALLAAAFWALPSAEAAVLFEEDFSTNPHLGNCWTSHRQQGLLTDEAYWDPSGFMMLTRSVPNRGAVMVPCSVLPTGDWILEYRWRVDVEVPPGGADGIVALLFKDLSYLPNFAAGGDLGMRPPNGQAFGYGVELDNWQNVWETNGRHLAIVGQNAQTHRVTHTPFPQAADGAWHDMRIEFCDGAMDVFVDGTKLLSDPGPFNSAYMNWAIASTAGTAGKHQHDLDDVLLRDDGCPSLPPPPPPPSPPPSPPPAPPPSPPPAPQPRLVAIAGGPYRAAQDQSVLIRGWAEGGTNPYSCKWTLGGQTISEVCEFPLSFRASGSRSLMLTVTDATGESARDSTMVYIYAYAEDSDQDGISDQADNCPHVPNQDQRDTDQDGRGDVCGDAPCREEGSRSPCDTGAASPVRPAPENRDADNDRVLDLWDNCPFIANADQADRDEDAIGDACDLDTDGDGVPDLHDNCPIVPNPFQEDSGAMGVGNACRAPDPPALLTPVRSAPVSGELQAAWSVKMGAGAAAFGAVYVAALVFARRRAK